MAYFSDRVKDTTTTTGTGDITLAGAPDTGFVAFATAYATGTPKIPYAIVHRTANEWEVGWGTLTASTTLQRTMVLRSTNSNAAVSFSAGTKDVFVTIHAWWMSDTIPRGRGEAIRLGAITL